MHQQTQPGPADDPTIADLEHVRRLLCENGDVLTSTAIDNTRRIKAYLIQFNHPMVTSLVQCLENQRANSGDIAAAFNQLQDYTESALNPLQDRLQQIRHEHEILGAMHTETMNLTRQCAHDQNAFQSQVVQPLLNEVALAQGKAAQQDSDISAIQAQISEIKSICDHWVARTNQDQARSETDLTNVRMEVQSLAQNMSNFGHSLADTDKEADALYEQVLQLESEHKNVQIQTAETQKQHLALIQQLTTELKRVQGELLSLAKLQTDKESTRSKEIRGLKDKNTCLQTLISNLIDRFDAMSLGSQENPIQDAGTEDVVCSVLETAETTTRSSIHPPGESFRSFPRNTQGVLAPCPPSEPPLTELVTPRPPSPLTTSSSSQFPNINPPPRGHPTYSRTKAQFYPTCDPANPPLRYPTHTGPFPRPPSFFGSSYAPGAPPSNYGGLPPCWATVWAPKWRTTWWSPAWTSIQWTRV